jgi:hypothetical protein
MANTALSDAIREKGEKSYWECILPTGTTSRIVIDPRLSVIS